MTKTRTLLTALLAATTLGAGVAAYSQTGGIVWDTSQLPETKGVVKQYTLTPRGDVDGLILNDGTEVKLAPHLTGQVVFSIRPGDAVTIHGLKARALPLVDAASVTNDTTGKTVVDDGPPDRRDRPSRGPTISGRITATLHGKGGEVDGALLDNGTVLRLPPPEAEQQRALLQPGQSVSVRGATLDTPLGTVIAVEAIGNTPGRLTDVAPPPPPPPPPLLGARRGPGGEGPAAFAPAPPPPPPPPPPAASIAPR